MSTALVLRHENGRRTPLTATALAAREYLENYLGIEHQGCLLWPFSQSNGYGFIRIRHKTYRVTVLACEFRWGPMPLPRMHAAHGRLRRCESTLCWNGDHLSWKTAAENAEDKTRDGTKPMGEDFRRARLTAAAVRDICNRYAQGGISQQSLADEYGVTMPTVSYMLRGKTWKHIDGARIAPRLHHWNTGRSAKLTATDVKEIRRLHAEGETSVHIAHEFGVDASSVSNIINRKTWSHL